MASNIAPINFPKLDYNEFTDWKTLIPAQNGKQAVEYRVGEKNRNYIIITVRAATRDRVVSRDIKGVLYDNRGVFGAHNAGIAPFGGSALPLYDLKQADSTKPVAFQQDYRFTFSI